MKFKGLYVLLIITLILQPLSFTLAAKEQVNEPQESYSVYMPMLNNHISPVIPDTTKVIDSNTGQLLEDVSEDGAVFTFSDHTPLLQDLVPGDVMVGEPVDAAEEGFLRMVTGVTESGGRVIVETMDATIEDAIQDGGISENIELLPEDIHESSFSEGVELIMLPGSGDQVSFEYLLSNVVLKDQNGKRISVDGSIKFTQGFNFNISVKSFKLQNLSFVLTAKETAELKVTSDLAMTISETKDIASHKFKPITLWIGWVPVVIVPTLNVYVGFDGSVHVGVTAGVTQEATATAGLAYSNGSWGPVSDFSNKFTWDAPTLYGGLDLKAYAGVGLTLKLYGAAGPFAKVQVYLKFEAATNRVPWWELYGGFEVLVGVQFKVLSNMIANYEFIVLDLRFSILRANIPPDPPSTPSPANGVTDQRLKLLLTWTGRDPDSSSLTYDVYLEADDDTPDLLVCHTMPSASCEQDNLLPDTQYFWQVVARDGSGDTTASPVWSFTTGNGFPGAFNKVSPTNGAVELPIHLILNWEDSQDAMGYQYCLVSGEGEGCSDWVDIEDAISQVSPNELFEGSPYRWQVRATNAYGTTYADGAEAAFWSFTTGIDIPSETVLVPAGDFWMGSEEIDDYINDADPPHDVTLSEYVIDKYEVTNAQYARCVRAGVCEIPAFDWNLEGFYTHAATYPDYPVNYVNWNHASEYCTWAGMRLPTEAEWEKAARGTNKADIWYPWEYRYPDLSPDCSLANYQGVGGYGCVGRPTRVGSYTYGASQYGAMDMAGNLVEWVSDWYDAEYYSTSPTDDPTGPDTGTEKVLRGGHWDNVQIQVFYRDHADPTPGYGSPYNGFRCAAAPPGP
jgi:formylglycine-generating enzyme required for sulfatase activity